MRERRPGVWQLRVFLGVDSVTGKRRYTGRFFEGGKREAQRALARLVAEAEALATTSTSASGGAKQMTLAELVEEHIRRHEGSPTTLRTYRSILETHIRPSVGRVPLTQIDPAILDRYYEHLVSGGLSASSVHQLHAVIRGALRRAVRWGWLTSNPARDAAPPTGRHAETVMPTTDQVVAAIDAAYRRDPKFGTFVRLAAATGARRGELCALRWGSIDLDRGSLRIVASAYVEPGVGVLTKATKNHSVRDVNLDAETVRRRFYYTPSELPVASVRTGRSDQIGQVVKLVPGEQAGDGDRRPQSRRDR